MLLILIWGMLISLIILIYVLLDGFDLGIGILYPFIKDSTHKDVAMSTILPVWDGNETWLVYGAACLYAGFPLAYSVLLPALYMPIMIMLAALLFRGVAFEFRFKALKTRFVWDIAFSAGSIMAAFMQGCVLGTFIKGYGDTIPGYVSTMLWLTPFSVMTGIAVCVGYALLGSTWLIFRTHDSLQQQMFGLAKKLLVAICIFLIIVSAWTPFISPVIYKKWFTGLNWLYLSPLPIITGLAVLYNFNCLNNRYELSPFLLSVSLFFLSYVGFCYSCWPYIVPHSVTIWQAAAPASTLKFLLVGSGILFPFLLIYTAYAYRIFRGKVKETLHY